MFNTPYVYYIGSAYAIAFLSWFIFLAVTILQARNVQKRTKRLEKLFKNNDF